MVGGEQAKPRQSASHENAPPHNRNHGTCTGVQAVQTYLARMPVASAPLPSALLSPRIPGIRLLHILNRQRMPAKFLAAAEPASAFSGEMPAVRIILWGSFAVRAQRTCDRSRSCKLEEVCLWACGAAGSALPWHGRGRRFDPDQVHQTVFPLFKSANNSQQSPNIPAKCVPFAPGGHRRRFSAH